MDRRLHLPAFLARTRLSPLRDGYSRGRSAKKMATFDVAARGRAGRSLVAWYDSLIRSFLLSSFPVSQGTSHTQDSRLISLLSRPADPFARGLTAFVSPSGNQYPKGPQHEACPSHSRFAFSSRSRAH